MDTNKTLTPLQLWQDYNPTAEALEINIIAREVVDEIETTEYAFTPIKTAEGRARTFVKVFKGVGADKAPIILYIPDYYERGIDLEKVAHYVSAGFVVATVDYSGTLAGKEHYATYPKDLAYGNILEAGARLNTAQHGARETSVHLWVKVIRRTLTLLESLQGCDDAKFIGVSRGEGAGLLWQAAGIDARFDTIVPMLNCGYAEYSGHDKYGDDPTPHYDEERTRWNAGCAVQAYAKFVTADVFCITSSNSARYSMDRLWDTMALLPESNQHVELVEMGLQEQLYQSTHEAIFRYLSDKYIDKKKCVNAPTVEFSTQENKLICDITSDNYDQLNTLEVYYAHGEKHSAFRNWNYVSVGVDMQGKASVALKVYDSHALLFCIAQVTYRNGMRISSAMQAITPATIGDIKPSIRAQRIVFEKKIGLKSFFPKTKGAIVDDETILLEKGPLDIMGVTAGDGDLVNYAIGDIKCQDEDVLLQIDLYGKSTTVVKVSVIDSLGKEYCADITLEDNTEWSKCQLGVGEFKDAGFMPLKDWHDIKYMTIHDASKVLVNNIIWV